MTINTITHMIEDVKFVVKDVANEWYTYARIMKYEHLAKKTKTVNKRSDLFIIGLALFLFFLSVKTLSADASLAGKVIPNALEPASLALAGGGILSMLVRFARKRFQEFKRGMDVLFSLAGLVIVSPVLLVVGILIKLTSRGPVFFKQERVGKDRVLFDMHKLRTMKMDAENDTGPVWAQENDPRLTIVGKFLRKTHIDELPQFINVLKGEMSIVGPRPERPVFVAGLSREIKDYTKRLKVKPGITGLAQVVNKYDETIEDVKRKIKYDLLYIREMCLMVDLRIIARTFLVVLTGKGAR